MRVIAGTARRIILDAPKGDGTRPTTDRIKETLFNMINDELYDINFLDLFAGSGGIGIEALSRGASHATFVEKNRDAIDVIKKNLEKTHLADKANVLGLDVLSAVTKISGGMKYHIVFMDPPYESGLDRQVLFSPAFLDIVADKGLVIIEADINNSFSPEDYKGFKLLKEKLYKSNKHIFLEKE